MKVGKTKKELIEVAVPYFKDILEDDTKIREIALELKKYNIKYGDIMTYLNNPEKLYEADILEVGLFIEQVYLKANNTAELEPSLWFNPAEISEFRQYYKSHDEDEVNLPLTFENVTDLGDGVYAAPIDNAMIARMYKSGLLNYNPAIQREGKKAKLGENIIIKPTLNKTNIKEIKELVLKGKLKKTALAYNCAPDTTTDELGYELIYDDKKQTLTITEGTKIDILDGMHRTRGILEAYKENPEIKGKMIVLFSNYTTAEAREYQVQLSKATPISKVRIKELESETLSAEIVRRLNSEGELKDKISSTARIQRSLGEVTSFDILVDAIEKFYAPKKRIPDVKNVTKIINEYMSYLFGYFDEHVNNQNNLLFERNFFFGHILLSKRMYDRGISFEKLDEILGNIDFSRDNQMWENIGVLSKGYIDSKKSLRYIEKFFEEIELNREVEI